MLVDRLIKRAVYEEVKRVLESEKGDLKRYNVYGEDELRQYREGNFTPTAPFCFVVSSKIAPAVTELPFIAVDTYPIRKTGLELGNRKGRRITVNLNVLGRAEGEVLDLVSVLLDEMKLRFPIRNYNAIAFDGFRPNEVMAYAEVEREPAMQSPGLLAEELIKEGTLHNWQIVNFEFKVLL